MVTFAALSRQLSSTSERSVARLFARHPVTYGFSLSSTILSTSLKKPLIIIRIWKISHVVPHLNDERLIASLHMTAFEIFLRAKPFAKKFKVDKAINCEKCSQENVKEKVEYRDQTSCAENSNFTCKYYSKDILVVFENQRVSHVQQTSPLIQSTLSYFILNS